jgi:hypothetical protein
MRFTWDAEACAWAAVVACSGPAGASPTNTGTIGLEFDRLDCGRVVRLMVPVDADARDAGRRVFGDSWAVLGRPGTVEWETVDVDLTGTPLWTLGRDLARSAQLAEDVARLAMHGHEAAAAIASAELAQVLHGLADLAPCPAEEALYLVAEHLGGEPPRVAGPGTAALRELAEELAEWAPAAYAPLLRMLARPVFVEAPMSPGEPNPAVAWSALSPVDTAVRLGRRAIDLEQQADDSTANTWRDCAASWLDADEVGRAAIALDRAADVACGQGQNSRAQHDRQRALALAPAWARGFLGGRTGTPYRAVWRRAVGPAVPAFPFAA